MNEAVAVARAFVADEATSNATAAAHLAPSLDPDLLLRGPGPARVLYAVTEHADGFRALVSDRSDAEGFSYGIALTLTGAPPKIAGWASANPFGPDGAVVWEPLAGAHVTGPPIAATKLRRPQDPDSAADYDALP